MASSRRPRMSLPPELGAIDEAWGEDEQPTIARPSRIPTAAKRSDIPSEAPTAPGFDFSSLRSTDEEDELDRDTTVPEIPLDDYARRLGKRSDVAENQPTDAPPPLGLDLDVVGVPHIQLDSVGHPSTYPTAPPPVSFNSQRAASREEVPPPPVVARFSVQPTGPTYPPERIHALDQPVFSGRFSSAPPGETTEAARMKGKFAMGDFSGALDLAETILNKTPSNTDAQTIARKSREVLIDMYASRISGVDRVPRVSMSAEQIRWLSLDHRAGFLLSMIDGISSVDELLDISGMPRLDALRILSELLEAKVISL